VACSWRMKITAASRHSAAEAGSGKHTCQGDAGQGSAPGIGWEVTRRCQMSTQSLRHATQIWCTLAQKQRLCHGTTVGVGENVILSVGVVEYRRKQASRH
jgi:hypothetical protein